MTVCQISAIRGSFCFRFVFFSSFSRAIAIRKMLLLLSLFFPVFLIIFVNHRSNGDLSMRISRFLNDDGIMCDRQECLCVCAYSFAASTNPHLNDRKSIIGTDDNCNGCINSLRMRACAHMEMDPSADLAG